MVEFDSSEEDEWYIAAIVKKGSYKYETIKRKPLPIIKSELYFDSYIILYELRTLEDEAINYLEEICEMKTDFIAEAICPYAGRVLVGIKDTLCLCNYETGLFVEANLVINFVNCFNCSFEKYIYVLSRLMRRFLLCLNQIKSCFTFSYSHISI